MGNATYYNQKDRDQFPEGWFGEAGRAMNARKRDGSLTLGATQQKKADAFEPYATRSTMPEGKAPGKVEVSEPGYSHPIEGTAHEERGRVVEGGRGYFF